MAYATTAQLKAAMNKTSADDDEILGRLLDAATVWIDRAINQYTPGLEFFDAAITATARVYGGSGKAWQRIDPCISITTVAVKTDRTASTYTAWDDDDDWIPYSGSHQFPNFNDLPYTAIMTNPGGSYATFLSGRYGTIDDYFSMSRNRLHLRGRNVPTVQVTARWGYSESPPADITDACIKQCARWYKREQSAMADALASGELGQLVYRLEMDPDIAAILQKGRYYKPAIGGR